LEAANYTPYKHSIVQPMRQLLLTRNNAQIIKEVFAETGCAVVVPPEQAPVVYIIGPSQQLPQAVAAVATKMEPYHSITLDIKNAYYVPPSMPAPAKGKKPAPPTPEQQAAILLAAKTAKAYAIDVARHMRKMGTLKALEKELGVEIIYPSDTTLYDLNLFCPLLIVGRTQEAVNAAKGRVVEIANKYRSSEGRVSHLYIEPLRFKHIHGKDGKGAKKLAAATSVELLFPEDAEDDQITLFYEGEATEAEEIAAAIEQAKEQVNELVKDQIEIVSKVLPITQELHEKVQGERGTIINALNPSSVHIQFGAPKARFGRPAPASAENAENTITLRGPPAGVSSTAAAIVQFLKENEDKETADVVTEPYTYPAKFSGNLIGAKGANINKLRDDYGVEIKLSEGSGEITGVKVCVDAARRKLNAQVKEFEDKAVLHVKVPQQFHSVIIGPGGSTVRRLEERYDVRINFPKAAKEEDGEAPKQAADEIVIKGSKKGAEEARKEIDELYKYEAENAHTATISVLAKSVGYMFKNASKDIKALRDESSARIIIPQEDKDAEPESIVEIKIRGTKADVAHAKAVLSKIAKTAEDTSVKTIVVDKKFHRALIGPGGNTLRDIVVKAGGPDDRQAQARLVRFPNQDSESNEITVQGSSGIVDKIIASIERIVAEKENQVTEILPVAPEKHRKLIGREGATRRDLEAKFKVTIDIPRQRPGVPQTNPDIKITGVPSAVEECKAHITEMVKEPDGELLEVPRRLHHAIADGGFFMQLQKDFKVTVDHNGIPRPSKPEDPKPSSAKDMPLITDDGSDEKIFWEVVENTASGEEGTYPWVLRGKPEQVEQAKAEIQRAIENAEKQSFTGFLILPDPRKYRLVVGPGGSTVDKIRKETGCRITVPRNQTGGGEAIVLNGDKNGLEQAKDAILKVVAGNDK
jgi:rRNA processing protein Krr1/Pno1